MTSPAPNAAQTTRTQDPAASQGLATPQDTSPQELAPLQDASLQQQDWMRLAIAQALLARDAGEVPVGAVVLSPAGEILGRGNNSVLRTHDPSAHAEIVALRSAGAALGNYRLLNCTLVCTLEPCAMCAGALLHARVSRLIFAARDPKAGACGSVLAVMNHGALNHTVAVKQGVLAAECGALLSGFFRRRRAEQAAGRRPLSSPEPSISPPCASE